LEWERVNESVSGRESVKAVERVGNDCGDKWII